ncbi:MAG: universal stress protein [Alphaproteobacteria bacterium]|nr:universal stress protein [Alphaproteobacteria bacterium]
MNEQNRRTKFLVVVDQTPECRTALRFATQRARKVGGNVILLHVIEPPAPDGQQWMSVANLMQEEAREQAEQLMQQLASQVHAESGINCELVIREGRKRDELLGLISEDPSIRILVLGAASGGEGPGPLVSALAGQMSGSMRVPITVVPGNLSNEQIDALT